MTLSGIAERIRGSSRHAWPDLARLRICGQSEAQEPDGLCLILALSPAMTLEEC